MQDYEKSGTKREEYKIISMHINERSNFRSLMILAFIAFDVCKNVWVCHTFQKLYINWQFD